MRQKSDLFDGFKNVQKVENRSVKRVKCLPSDNGKEYFNKEFDAYLRLKGIARRLTVPHTLLEATRCLLMERNMSPGYWAEAVTTACYLQNRHPSSAIDFQIPFELWFGKEMHLDHLFIPFGTVAGARRIALRLCRQDCASTPTRQHKNKTMYNPSSSLPSWSSSPNRAIELSNGRAAGRLKRQLPCDPH